MFAIDQIRQLESWPDNIFMVFTDPDDPYGERRVLVHGGVCAETVEESGLAHAWESANVEDLRDGEPDACHTCGKPLFT